MKLSDIRVLTIGPDTLSSSHLIFFGLGLLGDMHMVLDLSHSNINLRFFFQKYYFWGKTHWHISYMYVYSCFLHFFGKNTVPLPTLAPFSK